MGKKSTVIHVNPNLAHQVVYGDALVSGFKRHGIDARIGKAEDHADLHVCIGPWYAYRRWQYANTLYLDRAYWDNPNSIAVHWLDKGEKVFLEGQPKRAHPDSEDYKEGDRVIYLCDYGQQPAGEYHTARLHAAQQKDQRTLCDDLALHQIARGRRTTALVDAALAGLMVETDDIHSPVYPISGLRSKKAREKWLNDLAWHNWTHDEIANGDMLDAIGTAYESDKDTCLAE